MSESTADKFCRVLARLQAIRPDNDEPMRHQMRGMKNVALQIIDNALTQADQLAWAASDMSETFRDELSHVLKASQDATNTQGDKHE